MLPEPVLPSPAKPTTGELVSPRGPLWAVAAGYATVAVSLLVFVGWGLDIGALKSVLPNAMAMKPYTAMSLLALGLATIAATVPKAPYVPSARRVLITRLLAALPLVISGVMLFEYLADIDLGIDQLMFREAVIQRGGPFPGRISPASSISTCLISLSLLLLDARSAKLRRLAHWPALMGATFSFIAVLGYLYGAQALYQIRPYASVALHTACCVLMLGGCFVLMRPDRSVARELFSQHHGGLMARRVLPLAILLPMVVGWLRLQGQKAGWYQTEVGLALFAASNVVIFSVVIWLAARTLNRVDADRRGADFRRLQALREAETRWRALIEASAQIVCTAGP